MLPGTVSLLRYKQCPDYFGLLVFIKSVRPGSL